MQGLHLLGHFLLKFLFLQVSCLLHRHSITLDFLLPHGHQMLYLALLCQVLLIPLLLLSLLFFPLFLPGIVMHPLLAKMTLLLTDLFDALNPGLPLLLLCKLVMVHLRVQDDRLHRLVVLLQRVHRMWVIL